MSVTYLLVHGAWHGGWCYQRVMDKLRIAGCRAYAPTLSGLCERADLLSPKIGLQTHVDEIVDLAIRRNLHEIILCGHSYGGMVISGAAEVLRQRVKAVVYLDALVPEAGRSVLDYAGPGLRAVFDDLLVRGGGRYLAPVPAKEYMLRDDDEVWVDSLCTPHPYKTFQDSLASVTAVDSISKKIYVLAARYNSEMMTAVARSLRSRPDWDVIDLPFGHELMIEAPKEVAEILIRAAE